MQKPLAWHRSILSIVFSVVLGVADSWDGATLLVVIGCDDDPEADVRCHIHGRIGGAACRYDGPTAGADEHRSERQAPSSPRLHVSYTIDAR